jgi:beta-phosphoglucomutase-like phosphatase (HAD superfamily)
LSPINFGPSDVNNPHNLFYAHVPESFWITKALIFDLEWIRREMAQAERTMPDHLDFKTTLRGLRETFLNLRRYEVRIAMTSNLSSDEVVRELSRLDLAHDFDSIRCKDDVKVLKPGTELYQITLDTLGIKPFKTVAFEVTPEGVAGAKAAGIFCVTPPGCPVGDLVLNSFLERPILHLLEDLDRMKKESIARN